MLDFRFASLSKAKNKGNKPGKMESKSQRLRNGEIAQTPGPLVAARPLGTTRQRHEPRRHPQCGSL